MARRGKQKGNDAPITVTYGNHLMDSGMASLPKAIFRFYRFLSCDGEQLDDREVLPLLSILALFEDRSLRLSDLPVTASEGSLKRYRAKWKRMGVVFTRRVYYTYAEMAEHFEGDPPSTPRLKSIVFDLTNLMYNIELVAQEWARRNLRLLMKWERSARKGEQPVYQFPDDYRHEVELSPEVAQRIVDGQYDKGKAGEDGSEHGWYIAPRWWHLAHEMARPSPRTGSNCAGTAGRVPDQIAPVQDETDPVPDQIASVREEGEGVPDQIALVRQHVPDQIDPVTKEEEKEEEEEEGSRSAHSVSSVAAILHEFAARKSDPAYQPTDRERAQVQQLLDEGFSAQQILDGIDQAFDSRHPSASAIRSFGFVVTYIHQRFQPTEAQPTETKPTEAAGHTDGQPTGAPSTGAQLAGARTVESTSDPLAQVYVLLQAAESEGMRYDTPIIRLRLRHFLEGYDDPFTADEVYLAVMETVSRNIAPSHLAGYTEAVLHDKRAEARERERLQRAISESVRSGVPSLNEPCQLPLLDDPGNHAAPSKTEVEQTWEAALTELELQMTKATFTTWIKPLKALSLENGTLVLAAPNEYVRDWVDNRLQTPIVRTISGIKDRPIELAVTVNET